MRSQDSKEDMRGATSREQLRHARCNLARTECGYNSHEQLEPLQTTRASAVCTGPCLLLTLQTPHSTNSALYKLRTLQTPHSTNSALYKLPTLDYFCTITMCVATRPD